MIKAVIFDMDGVIIDSEEMQQIAYIEAFRNQGILISPNDYTENTGRKDAFQRIAQKYDREADFDRLFYDKNKTYHQLIKKGDIKPMNGLLGLLNLIIRSKLKIGLASSSSLMNIRLILNALEIIEFFDVIVGIDHVRNGKPDPDLFLLTARKLKIKPQECVVIEDSPVGIEAAKRARMRCIGFTGKLRMIKDMPTADVVIDDLSKLDIDTLMGKKQD